MPVTADIDRDGPEVAALASKVADKIAEYVRQGMTVQQASAKAEEWLYSQKRLVPEWYYGSVLAEAEASMPWLP